MRVRASGPGFLSIRKSLWELFKFKSSNLPARITFNFFRKDAQTLIHFSFLLLLLLILLHICYILLSKNCVKLPYTVWYLSHVWYVPTNTYIYTHRYRRQTQQLDIDAKAKRKKKNSKWSGQTSTHTTSTLPQGIW